MLNKACRRALCLALAVILAWTGAAGIHPENVHAAGALELYTPYTEQDAAPGDSISYSIELINSGSETSKAGIQFAGGSGWDYELTAGGRNVRQIAVRAGESQTLNLRLEVPLEIEKGEYSFTVRAGDASLPLKVHVTEKGIFSSSLNVEQANIEGHSGSSFTFSAELRNQTAEEQTYALAAQPEAGWEVRFKSGGNSVTSVTIDPNSSQTLSVEAIPPDGVQAGTYSIPIAAMNNNTQAEAKLEAVITGTYGIELTTADERLNATVRAGSSTTMELIVKNSGTAKLEDVSLSAQTPSGWEVTFEPKTISSIEPGQTAAVQAIVASSEKSLPGDYALNLSAQTAQKSASAAIRVAVKSSVLWGWIGVLIIAAVIGGVYVLFRRYGRR